eukprot:352960-Chlamydomonas_euryale.AAC.2
MFHILGFIPCGNVNACTAGRLQISTQQRPWATHVIQAQQAVAHGWTWGKAPGAPIKCAGK